MRRFHPLITGTLLLTAVGFFCRILGFFYRIFLSRTIGAEGLGLYQMIFPIHGIAFSLCAGPIQTSLSRLTAASPGKGRAFLRVSLALSLSIALPLTIFIYLFADFLAAHVLLAPECAPLLPALALSIPFCAIHACCCGYYYGLKKTTVPAFSQVVEQCIRISSVLLIVHVCHTNGIPITVLLAVWGLLIGETASAVFCLLVYGCSKPVTMLPNTDKSNKGSANNSDLAAPFVPSADSTDTPISRHSRQTRKNTAHFQYSSHSTPPYTPDTSSTTLPAQKKSPHTLPLLLPLLSMALPLMANRLTLSFLQSLEAIFVPNQLLLSGLSRSEAVSLYGVLTGMALPFILFPSAITNSLAVVLLPAVSEAQAQNQPDKIERTISMALRYSLYMGILCVGLFTRFGPALGKTFYHNADAGRFIQILSWLCPFLYLSTTMGSILNGLGKTGTVFLHHTISMLLTLSLVLFAIPRWGIFAYLAALLISELVLAVLHIHALAREVPIRLPVSQGIVKPVFCLLVSVGVLETLSAQPRHLSAFFLSGTFPVVSNFLHLFRLFPPVLLQSGGFCLLYMGGLLLLHTKPDKK